MLRRPFRGYECGAITFSVGEALLTLASEATRDYCVTLYLRTGSTATTPGPSAPVGRRGGTRHAARRLVWLARLTVAWRGI